MEVESLLVVKDRQKTEVMPWNAKVHACACHCCSQQSRVAGGEEQPASRGHSFVSRREIVPRDCPKRFLILYSEMSGKAARDRQTDQSPCPILYLEGTTHEEITDGPEEAQTSLGTTT